MYNVVLVSGAIQLYINVYPLFFIFFPHMVYYRILSWIPCVLQ